MMPRLSCSDRTVATGLVADLVHKPAERVRYLVVPPGAPDEVAPVITAVSLRSAQRLHGKVADTIEGQAVVHAVASASGRAGVKR